MYLFPLEAKDGANNGLDIARKRLEQVKAKHPEISYADLWVLASYVAIESMGGPHIEFRGGRKDATDEKACPPNGRLPDASKGAQHVRDVFGRLIFLKPTLKNT
ncbi:Peroxidase family protein [Reticulomyxa filosa]|uniref:Cytochrome c peroxidase, mitochondrial n=1 Tax=Reticulomyxa filosa TaxID=46433 RepID=X6NG82_RETFI|nr:Peroxidase family protein [Reticulomyxa filosa]|eukprot:ETO24986.1 Peroxidase family protein [Reticulomyxa filosa]